jgi:heme-degrading monooxygenase HmoA
MTAKVIAIADRLNRGEESDGSLADVQSTDNLEAVPANNSSVAVFSSYIVSPGDAESWIETWQGIAVTAATWPGCRSFRLVRDRNDDMFIAMFSGWDSMAAYRTFLHETATRWLHGTGAQKLMPGESRFLDVVPVEAPMRTARWS